MFPYLLRTDSGFIYTFTAVWLIGLAVAVLLIYRQDRHRFEGWDGLLVAGIMSLLLGRLQFVWQNGEWFVENPAERWNLSQGGFGYAGAIFGGLLGLCLWSFVTQTKLRPIMIRLIPIVPLLHFVGWLACWFDGCGYGATTFLSRFSTPLPDNFGLIAVRYQTQMSGMIIALFLLVVWLILNHYFYSDRPVHITVFWMMLALLSMSRGIIYLYQGDEFPLIGQYRADMLLALSIAFSSAFYSFAVALGEVIYSKPESEA